jgi:hypothetical protein
MVQLLKKKQTGAESPNVGQFSACLKDVVGMFLWGIQYSCLRVRTV